jgi:hypothetical protein
VAGNDSILLLLGILLNQLSLASQDLLQLYLIGHIDLKKFALLLVVGEVH